MFGEQHGGKFSCHGPIVPQRQKAAKNENTMGIQNFWETHQNPWLVSDMSDFKWRAMPMGRKKTNHHPKWRIAKKCPMGEKRPKTGMKKNSMLGE